MPAPNVAGRISAPSRFTSGVNFGKRQWSCNPARRTAHATVARLTPATSLIATLTASSAGEWAVRPDPGVSSIVGDDPLMMLTGPIPATRRILERTGLRIDDLDAYEVNEAFASVPLAWAAEVGADAAKLNPWGGAIALGHALGSSGTRLLGTLLANLEATGGRYGLQTMCEGGGMANATIIERL